VDVPHYGTEGYQNMWQKTRSILAYMYDNYFDDYEYFYLAGDDTHLIVENLRRYLYTVEQTHDVATEALYMGAVSYRNEAQPYNDGGAGYVLNRVALKRLVLEAFPRCYAETQISAEDLFVGRCLRRMKINPLHTVDAQGRQRFILRPPEIMGSSYNGKDAHRFSRNLPKSQLKMGLVILNNDWARKYGWRAKVNRNGQVFENKWARKYGWRIGADIVSESSITFHTGSTDELMMKRHHAIIYDSCPVGTVLHAAVQKGRDARDNSTVAVVARR
jgi:hypothetical protein